MTVSEAAIKRGPSGFLSPQRLYVVRVGESLIPEYSGFNKREAERAFYRWVKLSESGLGRAAGQKISISRDGVTVKESK